MTLLGLLDLACKLGLFGWFGYARRHFSPAGKEPLGMTVIKITFVIGLLGNLWIAVFGPGTGAVMTALGLVATLAAAWVFHRAAQASKAANLHVAFSETTGSSLVSTGIYAHVRHPFYLTYLIYWLSWCLSLGFHPLAVAIFVFLLVLYIFSIRVEERQLEKTFGDEYRAYKARTALLLPGIL